MKKAQKVENSFSRLQKDFILESFFKKVRRKKGARTLFYVLCGYTYKEIGEKERVKIGTIKSRVSGEYLKEKIKPGCFKLLGIVRASQLVWTLDLTEIVRLGNIKIEKPKPKPEPKTDFLPRGINGQFTQP